MAPSNYQLRQRTNQRTLPTNAKASVSAKAGPPTKTRDQKKKDKDARRVSDEFSKAPAQNKGESDSESSGDDSDSSGDSTTVEERSPPNPKQTPTTKKLPKITRENCTPEQWSSICNSLKTHRETCPKVVQAKDQQLTEVIEHRERLKAKVNTLKKDYKELQQESNEQLNRIHELEQENQELEAKLAESSTKLENLKKRKGGGRLLNDRRNEAKDDVSERLKDFLGVIFRKRKYFRTDSDIEDVCDELYDIMVAKGVEIGGDKKDFREIYSPTILEGLGNRRQYVQSQGFRVVKGK